MADFLHTLMMVGGLAAAVAVALMCAVCLVVWMAGGKHESRK